MKQATDLPQTGGVTTTVASTVMRVAELDRSVNFYRDVFCCRVAPTRTGHSAAVDTGRVSDLSALDWPVSAAPAGPYRYPIPDVGHRQPSRVRAGDHPSASPRSGHLRIHRERGDVRGGLRPRPRQGHRRLSQPEPAATRADRVAAARGGTCRDRSKRHARSESLTGTQSLRRRSCRPGLRCNTVTGRENRRQDVGFQATRGRLPEPTRSARTAASLRSAFLVAVSSVSARFFAKSCRCASAAARGDSLSSSR